MEISIIVACSKNWVIGKENELPWRLSADLKRFKRLTMGKPIVMGRKTFLSIGKILPHRENIILSRDPLFKVEGATTFTSLGAALQYLRDKGTLECMIIGGAKLYHETYPMVDKIYLTQVDAMIEGDAYFPAIDFSLWEIAEEHEHLQDEKNQYNCKFINLVRK